MIKINKKITAISLVKDCDKVFQAAGPKIKSILKSNLKETPVFTIKGKYTQRGWTEWTQGFQFGCAILQYDATNDAEFLKIGRDNTLNKMAHHISHIGVHDHGFNNVSTYGNLLRLMNEKKIAYNEWEKNFYELSLKITGAVQAARWMSLPGNLGYITSFNGKHSLFSDTIRSCRALAVSHQLGHVLMSEQDEKVNLLVRLLQHAETTAKYNVYFGKSRDTYDISGRVVHESIFNTANGAYRCASSQQGYSPFSTWTRGHAWILAGYPEQIEFLDSLSEKEFTNILPGVFKNKKQVIDRFLEVADATAEFYIEQTPTDGIPYWDTGAPGLSKMGNYLDKPADPFNAHEPVDSSAAAIAAQGLIRLGLYYISKKQSAKGNRYLSVGLTTAKSLFQDPYLSFDPSHQGLLLHSVYHRPNNWDHIPKGQKVPNGEACMWGDYHLMELALLISRIGKKETYYQFFL
jgi:hypothetical protein